MWQPLIMYNDMFNLRNNDNMQQFVRFCLMWVLATALYTGLVWLLGRWMSYQGSVVVSYTICLCLITPATILWSFRTRINIRNVAGVVWTYLLNIFVVKYKTMVLFAGVLHLSRYAASLLTIVICMLTSYFIIKTIIR